MELLFVFFLFLQENVQKIVLQGRRKDLWTAKLLLRGAAFKTATQKTSRHSNGTQNTRFHAYFIGRHRSVASGIFTPIRRVTKISPFLCSHTKNKIKKLTKPTLTWSGSLKKKKHSKQLFWIPVDPRFRGPWASGSGQREGGSDAPFSCCSSRDTFRGGATFTKLYRSPVGWKEDTGGAVLDAADGDCCNGPKGPELLPFKTQARVVSLGKGSSVQRNASMGPFVLARWTWRLWSKMRFSNSTQRTTWYFR